MIERSHGRRKQVTSFFEKKEAKKLLPPSAVARPTSGRSKAGESKNFLLLFFQKRSAFSLYQSFPHAA
jgi:hypothetical protein